MELVKGFLASASVAVAVGAVGCLYLKAAQDSCEIYFNAPAYKTSPAERKTRHDKAYRCQAVEIINRDYNILFYD